MRRCRDGVKSSNHDPRFEMSFLEQFFEDNFDVPPTPPGIPRADGSTSVPGKRWI